jgi:hypothetical protein
VYKQSESASGNIAGGRSTGRQVDYCLFTLSEHVFQKSLTVHLLRLSKRAIYRERERDRERDRERERERRGGEPVFQKSLITHLQTACYRLRHVPHHQGGL